MSLEIERRSAVPPNPAADRVSPDPTSALTRHPRGENVETSSSQGSNRVNGVASAAVVLIATAPRLRKPNLRFSAPARIKNSAPNRGVKPMTIRQVVSSHDRHHVLTHVMKVTFASRHLPILHSERSLQTRGSSR